MTKRATQLRCQLHFLRRDAICFIVVESATVATAIRCFYTLFVCTLVSVSPPSVADQPAPLVQPTSPCQLTAGFDEAVPFHFRDHQGQVIGSDAELLSQVLANIGCQLQFIERPWSRTLAGVQSGKIDVAIGAGVNPSRLPWGYYSVPYKHITHSIYTRSGFQLPGQSLETALAQDFRLGVISGWGYPPRLREILDTPAYKKNIEQVGSFTQLPKLLKLERIDGLISPQEMLLEYKKENNSANEFIEESQYQEDLHFIFSKKTVSPGIILDFNNELLKLIHSGQKDHIFAKYNLNN